MSPEKSDGIVGAKIKAVRWMTDLEKNLEGWGDEGQIVVLQLDSGVCLYASMDEEGNGPGALFGRDGKKGFLLFPPD